MTNPLSREEWRWWLNMKRWSNGTTMLHSAEEVADYLNEYESRITALTEMVSQIKDVVLYSPSPAIEKIEALESLLTESRAAIEDGK